MPFKSYEALMETLDLPANPEKAGPVLDIACGKGRTGLKLSLQGTLHHTRTRLPVDLLLPVDAAMR